MPIINTVTGGGGSGKGKVIDGEVTPRSFPTTYPAPDGFVGWANLTVNAPENLSEENIRKDVTIAGVTGIYEPQPNLQDKTLKPTEFPSTVAHDEGYGGLGTVTVESPDGLIPQNIKAGSVIAGVVGTYDPQPNLQSVTKTPTEFPISIAPSEGYDGLSDVTVNAPAGLRPENIPEGVTIAGVEGTYVGPPTDRIGVDYVSGSKTYEPAIVLILGEYYRNNNGSLAGINMVPATFDNTIKPTVGALNTSNKRCSFAYNEQFIGVCDDFESLSQSTYIPSNYYWVHVQETVPEGEYPVDCRFMSKVGDYTFSGTVRFPKARGIITYCVSTTPQYTANPTSIPYECSINTMSFGDLTLDVVRGESTIHLPEIEVDCWVLGYSNSTNHYAIGLSIYGNYEVNYE